MDQFGSATKDKTITSQLPEDSVGVDGEKTCIMPPGSEVGVDVEQTCVIGNDALQVVQIDNDQTCLMARSPYGELDSADLSRLMHRFPEKLISKQERDFALAAMLVRGKHISDRVLRDALRQWTPFGGHTLRQYLQLKAIIADEVLSQVEAEGNEYFKTLDPGFSGEQTYLNLARRTSTLLESLDPSGRVAKLFGISQIPKTIAGDETRSFYAKFRLIRKIGQGGLGSVWLAVDTSLNRYVAVKEISGNCDRRSAAVARFRREAEITGRLDHPSIVPIHIMGENEMDGRVFYVMRFLGNETLGDAIREYHEQREQGQENPLAFHRLLTAFVSVCQAIAYAHSNKVIHRDLKPQNVALDNFGQVIVLDWGLAKTTGMDDPQTYLREITELPNEDKLDATLAGQVMGTPLYMAPEQASGRLDEIDERTDVYGLGAILFSILTGYAPHELSQESLGPKRHVADLLDVILDRPLTHPRRLNAKIPVALEAICLKATAKDRAARYASALELSDDVQRWLANEPISAIQDPLPKRFGRWVKKHRRLSSTLSAMAFLTAVCLCFWGVSSYQNAVTAQQQRMQTRVDIVRDLRANLTSDIETLSENTRFMATLPPIQALIDVRRGTRTGTDTEEVWAARLRTIYSGLLDVNPSYTAVTYWMLGLDPTKNVRVENLQAQRGLQRTDVTEFLGRHLPAISELRKNEVYVGMPGRLVDLKALFPKEYEQKKFQELHVGLCLVAGVNVFDNGSDSKLGGVVIECDLEKLLIDHLELVYSSSIEVYLTDAHGRAAMRFTRQNGLQPVESSTFGASNDPVIQRYFKNPHSPVASLISPTLCVAKVPLSRHRSDHIMGLIVRFPDEQR